MINPNVFVFWAICGIIGYLNNGAHGALVGLLCGLIVSVILDFIDYMNKRR